MDRHAQSGACLMQVSIFCLDLKHVSPPYMEDTDMPVPFLQSNPNGAIWGNQVACCIFCPTVNSLSTTNILVVIASGFVSYLCYLHQELRIYAFHFAHYGVKLALPCLL